MIRWLLCTLLALIPAARSAAHFVFVVPEADGSEAKVILSETLEADEDVNLDLAKIAKLSLRDAAGKEAPLTLGKPQDHAFPVALPGSGERVVHGVVELGVNSRGGTPNRLIYYPKTILGDAFSDKANVGESARVEIVPVGKTGELKFKLLAAGKPAPNAEITVIAPDGKQKKVPTDGEGLTESFKQTGRYGAWARHFESTVGEYDGKKYEQIRRYAMLVADIGASTPAAAAKVEPAAPGSRYANLPEATSSFGAVASDGWLYVYGGHIAKTHNYSTEAVSGRFSRLNLTDGKQWETLPSGPALQGMNLATYDGKIYRVGGMQPRNKPGDKAENFSIADVARFNPETKAWDYLPPLPEARSSHDVAVIDGKLYVVGGWTMNGKKGNEWLDHAQVIDLKAEKPQWTSLKQPFQRRALIAAVNQGKLYVLGGFTADSDALLDVDIYDPKTGEWTNGPELPGKDLNGFAPAACSLNERLYISVGDGSLLRLDEAGKSWEKIAATTPRIVHRLAPFKSEILVIGGAAGGKNFDLIESVNVSAAPLAKSTPPTGVQGSADAKH